MRTIPRSFVVLALVSLAALPAIAQEKAGQEQKKEVANVAGAWEGDAAVKSADGQSNSIALYAEFKQEGTTVTGTVGPNPAVQMPLSDVALDGDTLSFTAVMPMRTLKFKLALAAPDRLEGTMTSEGEGAGGAVVFKRASATK
jgi:hypothetical protein